MEAPESLSIADLKRQLEDLWQLVDTVVGQAIECLVKRDLLLAKAVIGADEQIDQQEVRIEAACIRLLERQRPVGEDLRRVVAILKINDGLERVGDLAENIADIVVQVADWERFKRVGGCDQLGSAARTMVQRALRAMTKEDVRLAEEVIGNDAHVDHLQAGIRQRIEEEIELYPENAMPLLKLEYVTRQLERIGDLATNMAEEVITMVEGKIVRHDHRLLERIHRQGEDMSNFRRIL